MRASFDRLRQNSFVRSVTILVGGTAFGQAVTIAVLPLLTRLYSPSDFSVLAVYTGLLGMLGLVACLRFDVAIPLPERHDEGANLLLVALVVAALFSILVGLPCLLVPGWIAEVLNQPAIEPYLWLVPVGMFLTGAYSALQFWMSRNKAFSQIARTRVAQSLGGAATQVGFGWFGLAPVGLIIGHAISSGAGALGLGWATARESRRVFSQVRTDEMRRLMRLYQRFPLYSSIEVLANNAAIQVPVLVIAASLAGPEAGFLALAMRVMQAPMGLVGGAIGQVFYARASDELRAGRLGIFTAETLGGLLKSGVGPLIFVGVVSPVAFELIFGHEWSRAGEILAWMTPWFVLQFLASPVSMAIHVTNHPKHALVLQVFGFVLRVGCVVGALFYYRQGVTEVYALSGLVFYSACLFLVLIDVGCSFAEFVRQFRKSIVFILPWVFIGILVNYLIRAL